MLGLRWRVHRRLGGIQRRRLAYRSAAPLLSGHPALGAGVLLGLALAACGTGADGAGESAVYRPEAELDPDPCTLDEAGKLTATSLDVADARVAHLVQQVEGHRETPLVWHPLYLTGGPYIPVQDFERIAGIRGVDFRSAKFARMDLFVQMPAPDQFAGSIRVSGVDAYEGAAVDFPELLWCVGEGCRRR
ncbi:MAG: hypothetical protein ABI895_43500 [Deltaproteobacteria bacterium]